jgi:putative thiamine transport system substrate-binding protein
VRSFTFPGGTLANTHFVAIPYNAAAKAGALVVADFLLSPEAQARKQDPRVWGDPTVLDLATLKAEDRALFDALDLGIATLGPEELGPSLDEPHPGWMDRLESEWKMRYGVAN